MSAAENKAVFLSYAAQDAEAARVGRRRGAGLTLRRGSIGTNTCHFEPNNL